MGLPIFRKLSRTTFGDRRIFRRRSGSTFGGPRRSVPKHFGEYVRELSEKLFGDHRRAFSGIFGDYFGDVRRRVSETLRIVWRLSGSTFGCPLRAIPEHFGEHFREFSESEFGDHRRAFSGIFVDYFGDFRRPVSETSENMSDIGIAKGTQ